MTEVHHCPSCGLAFRNKPELEYHWAEEHDPRLEPETATEPAEPAEEEGRAREDR